MQGLQLCVWNTSPTNRTDLPVYVIASRFGTEDGRGKFHHRCFEIPIRR